MYASLVLTGSLQEETEKLLLDIRNSRYHVPEAVYQLDFLETGLPLAAYFTKQLDSKNTELSPRLKDKIHTTFVSAIALQLNSLKSGTFGLALASAYTERKPVLIFLCTKTVSRFIFQLTQEKTVPSKFREPMFLKILPNQSPRNFCLKSFPFSVFRLWTKSQYRKKDCWF